MLTLYEQTAIIGTKELLLNQLETVLELVNAELNEKDELNKSE